MGLLPGWSTLTGLVRRTIHLLFTAEPARGEHLQLTKAGGLEALVSSRLFAQDLSPSRCFISAERCQGFRWLLSIRSTTMTNVSVSRVWFAMKIL